MFLSKCIYVQVGFCFSYGSNCFSLLFFRGTSAAVLSKLCSSHVGCRVLHRRLSPGKLPAKTECFSRRTLEIMQITLIRTPKFGRALGLGPKWNDLQPWSPTFGILHDDNGAAEIGVSRRTNELRSAVVDATQKQKQRQEPTDTPHIFRGIIILSGEFYVIT